MRRVLLVLTAVLVTVVGGCSSQGSAVSAPTTSSLAATHAQAPEPDPTSPTTPAGMRTSPVDAAPAPQATSDTGAGNGAAAGSGGGSVVGTAVGTATVTGSAADTLYCVAVRHGMGTLASSGTATLRRLVTSGRAAAPQVVTTIQQAQTDLAAIEAAAPDQVRAAVGTVRQAWMSLGTELGKAGYDRASVVALSIKYLTNPAVAAAWETITTYTNRRCGVRIGPQP
jgi:hypothetical protein